MAQQVCTDDCLRDISDVKSPLKRASEAKVDLHCASRVDRNLGLVGGVEVQYGWKVPLSRSGRQDANVCAGVNEEPDVGATITDVEQR